MIHPIHCIAVYRCIRYAVSYTRYIVYRYSSVTQCDAKCIHLYRDTLASIHPIFHVSPRRMYQCIGVDRGCIRVPPWRSLASVRSSCRRLKLAQPCAPARGGQEAGCLEPRASCSSSTRRRSPARPSVSLSQGALPMVTRPRIVWD